MKQKIKLLPLAVLFIMSCLSCSPVNEEEKKKDPFDNFDNIGFSLGYLDSDGNFHNSENNVRIFTDIQFMSQLRYAAKTNYSWYIRIDIPKAINYNVDKIYIEIIGISENGKPFDKSEKISIKTDKVDFDSDNYIFVSDKPIVFIDNNRLQGEHDFCYAIFTKFGFIYTIRNS